MKKIISTISILIVMVSASSCRQQEGDLLSESNNVADKSSVHKRTNDSIKMTDSLNAAKQPLPGDPPPKNGHQW